MSQPRNEVKAGRLTLIVALCFLLLGANAFRMQILKGEYYFGLSEKNRLRVINLEGPRGKIFDRKGRLLADNRLSFNCAAIPREAKHRAHESLRSIASILGVDVEELSRRYHKRRPGAFNTVLVAEDITTAQAVAIEERLDSMPGFFIETRPQRQYPYAEATAHLLGYIGPLHDGEDEEMEDLGYKPGDWIGREGVEKFYETYLRGYSGGLQMEVNSRGRFIRALGVREPREGTDIRLTVDGELQDRIHGFFRGRRGAAVVMELREGGVLAINSSPSFDPNLFASRKGRRDVGPYLTDEKAPMVNRAVRSFFPPGSIFKIVTAMAALETRKINPNTTYTCPGYMVVGGNRFRCWNLTGHGPQALIEGMAHSCDVYFYSIGLAAGPDGIYKKALQFGLSRPTGIDLPGEKQGLAPSREWKKSTKKAVWYDGDTANYAIGQGYLLMTPIQAMVMAATTATDGHVIRPHVIDRINKVKAASRHASTVQLDQKNLRAVKEGLEAVVNSSTGTGRMAKGSRARVAGKTGTAEAGKAKETHAWFIGYAPADNPVVAVSVVLEHGGHGGVEAAEVANGIFEFLEESGYL